FAWGFGQLRRWWLPAALLALSIPIPALVTNALALPLQFKASSMGAALLDWRHVPVRLAGNVIQLPGRQLFVTEACSGLRSLTALLALGVFGAAAVAANHFNEIRLRDAVVAVPLALALALASVLLGRQARAQHQRTLGRSGNRGFIALARFLSTAALLVALTATLALAVFAVLVLVLE
ncbi:MAG: exosortase/archaeosortase family protein, partial [Gaiellaceae bacterium]